MTHIEDYTTWVDNEYNLWKQALTDSMSDDLKFNNFKNQDQVKRMLGVSDMFKPFLEKLESEQLPWAKLEEMDRVGNPSHIVKIGNHQLSGIGLRYVYYANKILNNLPQNTELKLVEIGGGYGGLTATIHIMAKEKKIKIKEYAIFDLPEVQLFQKYYLEKVITTHHKSNGIQKISFPNSAALEDFSNTYNYCISCYALGEFATPVKHRYINNVVSKIDHGFILWNPHQNRDEEGELLIKQHHPDLIINPENPPTGFYNLEMKF